MTKQRAVELLYYWQRNPDQTNFASQLFNLRMKADPENREKLIRGFPVEMEVFQEWYDSPTEEKFFKKYNLS